MPWKYIGYRGYSEFLSSDEDVFILRRFDTLNIRALLSLQDRVSSLEQNLVDFDDLHSRSGPEEYHNGSFRNDLEERREILDQIASSLSQYNQLLLQHAALQKYPKAPSRDIKNINRWHEHYENNVISEEEIGYLKHTEDLISVANKDKTPLRRMIDSSHRLRTLPIWKSAMTVSPPRGSEQVLYFSDKRIDTFASGVIVIVGLTMLLTPVWILQALDSLLWKLVVISIFVFIFLVTMSFTMVAKPFEALAATAAYAAVLMVFLQIDQSG